MSKQSQSPHNATKCQTLTLGNGRSVPGDVQRAWFGRGAHGKAERDWPLLLTIDLSDVCLIVMACRDSVPRCHKWPPQNNGRLVRVVEIGWSHH